MIERPPRKRIRDFGVEIGNFATGHSNSITDVAGVRVGHSTLSDAGPPTIRTGITAIVPGPRILSHDLFAGIHSFNGSGELTGNLWVDESGLLSSPICLTSTFVVGTVRDALVKLAAKNGRPDRWWLPVVGETYDGWLSDGYHANIGIEHVEHALSSASSGYIEEGAVGGGTGMMCHGYKAGIGTASRNVEILGSVYAVGVLVQANYGKRHQLKIAGLPVGQILQDEDIADTPAVDLVGGSSIIAVIATDAPLLSVQCKRLAQRATVGLSRAGGVGHNGSGDIFIAFSTATEIDPNETALIEAHHLPNGLLNPLFEAVADGVEEAILNSICAGVDMIGRDGHTARALPHDRLEKLLVMGRQNQGLS